MKVEKENCLKAPVVKQWVQAQYTGLVSWVIISTFHLGWKVWIGKCSLVNGVRWQQHSLQSRGISCFFSVLFTIGPKKRQKDLVSVNKVESNNPSLRNTCFPLLRLCLSYNCPKCKGHHAIEILHFALKSYFLTDNGLSSNIYNRKYNHLM